ncbi:uncharacterized protein LOC128959929 [Oppia nitens]|uniref:uncharacterized protein LOC128959929 n=1 Tax=Oppia nitens TaxID=1686743 RepID=UPI0023DA31FD|nr:uncharacterized protein LOC128959929 [Oppia nitens]
MVNNNKSSFDRFGDDLAELILRYQSLEDQLRLECVSKQFQSCGIQHRTHIIVTYDIKMKLKIERKFLTKKYLNTKNWSSLMKKCPNVRSVDILSTGIRQKHFIRAIHLFRRHWPQLRQIDCNIFEMSKKDIKFMCKMFPKMITQLFFCEINQINLIKPFISSMTNLQRLWINKIDDIFIGDQLMVKDLRQLSCNCSDTMLTHFKTFIDGNSGLTSIKLLSNSTDTSTTIVDVLSLIGRLQGLQRLELAFISTVNYSIVKPLISIANSCRRLKVLKLHLRVDSLAAYIETYSAIKHMKQLKRLDLNIYYTNNDNNDVVIDPTVYASLQPVNCWPQLTHLTLRLSHINCQFFTGLHRNLPKLQNLYISQLSDVFDSIYMSYLSELKSLMRLSVVTKNDFSINQSDVRQMVNVCRKLNKLFIYLNNEKVVDLSYDEKTIHLLRG